jgi:DNA-binding NarL/FixJ family response regulator
VTITVFLADDHAVFRDGLRLVLDAEGDIQVIGDAADGREAVDQVAQLCPDVVVMDIAMPELNGIEATRRIHASCSPTQVVILSMYYTTEHVFQALHAGARGYLPKESAGIEVVDAVRTVHAGHRYLSHRISDKVIDDYVSQRELAEGGSPLARLSSREREIIQLVVEGRSSAEIAGRLSLSQKTIETYRSRIMQKLGIDDLPGLVRFAILHGLTPLK